MRSRCKQIAHFIVKYYFYMIDWEFGVMGALLCHLMMDEFAWTFVDYNTKLIGLMYDEPCVQVQYT